MAIEKKSPEVRFTGFTEDWETDSFENLTTINQGLQISITNRFKKKIPESHFYITNEFLKEGAKSEYYILNPSESVLCTKDDVLMTRTGNTGEVVTGVNGAFHNNFFKIKFDREKIDKDYLVYFLKNETTQSLILRLAGVSTIPDLNHNDFYQIEMSFPKIEEQNKISQLLKNLDSLITNHQTQLTKLKNLKKAMLTKMFPQNGASVPEIRFKGFDGDWTNSSLDDEVLFFTGLTYSPVDVNSKANTLVLRSSNVKRDEIIDADNVYVDSSVVNCAYVEIGDIVVVVRNGSRNLIGKHAQVKREMKNTVIGAFMTGVRAKFPSFLNALLSTSLFQKQVEENLGATINQITTGVFKSMTFGFPKETEQEKIGKYFENLDNLITNHNEQLKKLNNIKKACLSKLFVA